LGLRKEGDTVMGAEPKKQIFENYPAWVVLAANAQAISIYLLGAVIMAHLGIWAMTAYLAMCLFLEVKLLATGCVHCYYFGKLCFSGKGIVSSWFFKKGAPEVLAKRVVTWKELVPDMLVALLPAGAAVFLLIRDFQWLVLGLLIGVLVLAFPVSGFIRGTQACCHCRQRELGCPAEKLFRPEARQGHN
jgi:hypothetical protein